MIRTNEDIVELKQEIEASPYLAAYKNRLRDLFDTIADLKRQLAERDAALQSPTITVHLPDTQAALDAYVQQCVDEALLEAAKRRCEWCARGLELDGSYHRASGEIGQHLCQSLDILSIAAARSRVQGKPTQEEE